MAELNKSFPACSQQQLAPVTSVSGLGHPYPVANAPCQLPATPGASLFPAVPSPSRGPQWCAVLCPSVLQETGAVSVCICDCVPQAITVEGGDYENNDNNNDDDPLGRFHQTEYGNKKCFNDTTNKSLEETSIYMKQIGMDSVLIIVCYEC